MRGDVADIGPEMPEESKLQEVHVEPEKGGARDVRQIEASLQKLWEKAKRLSDLLLRLNEENKTLRRRVEELERKEQQIARDLSGKEQELLRLQSNGSGVFTHEEKEALVSRIKDLIAKINARL